MNPYYDENGIMIYHGDCREVLSMLSADLCFDDPPYVGEPWWELLPALIESAKRVVVTPGASNAVRWTSQRDPFWTYAWLSAATSLGGSACLHIGWEPVLAFQRPLRPLGTDVLNYPISAQQGIGDHPWPKPLKLIRKIVSHWSNEGDVVLDPHMGTGMTLRAAKDLGRRAIGIEIEERYCEIAAKRLSQETLGLTA